MPEKNAEIPARTVRTKHVKRANGSDILLDPRQQTPRLNGIFFAIIGLTSKFRDSWNE
jgi:hypothetical protein